MASQVRPALADPGKSTGRALVQHRLTDEEQERGFHQGQADETRQLKAVCKCAVETCSPSLLSFAIPRWVHVGDYVASSDIGICRRLKYCNMPPKVLILFK